MNKRLTIPQAVLSAAIIATIMTIVNWMVDWEKKIHIGIFAFVIALIAAKISQLVIKDEPAED